MSAQGSNFTTRAGLIVLAVLVLVCAYFRLTALGVFLGVLLLLALVAFLWARGSLARIRTRLPGRETCAFPGETVAVEAELHNAKFLPLLWLDLTIPTPEQPCIGPEEGQKELTETFTWLMPQQKLHWRLKARALRRGVLSVETLSLRSGDGFGLADQVGKSVPEEPFRFVVYPALLPVDIAPVLRNMRELERARSGLYVDRTLLRSVRDYRPGDSFKDVNWRQLARSGEVQVNVRETLDVRRVCFIPDAESFTETVFVDCGGVDRETVKPDAVRFERMLSLIASLITRLTEREVLCSLALPGYGDTAAQLLVPESADTQVMSLLTALAEFDYRGEPTALALDELLETRHLLGQVYIFSRSMERATVDASAAEALEAIRVLAEAVETGDRTVLREAELIRE